MTNFAPGSVLRSKVITYVELEDRPYVDPSLRVEEGETFTITSAKVLDRVSSDHGDCERETHVFSNELWTFYVVSHETGRTLWFVCNGRWLREHFALVW